MKTEDFTNEVHHLVRVLKEDKGNKQFSDVIDSKGFQYVDLVMEGGGVLGIALVGFTYVLEELGIRFMQIGGASAGAINAMLIAGLGKPAEAKSLKILDELANVNLYDFVDGDDDARNIIDAWLNHGEKAFDEEGGLISKFYKYYIFSQGAQVVDSIKNDLGLNPGKVFQGWIKKILKQEQIETTKDLLDLLSKLPAGLKHRNGDSIEDLKPRLALIAADVSTQTKAVFPQMAELYWAKPDEVNPSNYVRASMSIPGFFHPFRVKNIPGGKDAMDRWGNYGYTQTLPESCVFIDGGIMSNFPINLFHRPDRVPHSPTFGVKLGSDDKKTADISSPLTLLSAIFDSARFNLDSDFIARNPDYHKLVSCIDTGDHNWLNFNMTDDEKKDLFIKGAREADRFLREFDWSEYKDIRKNIAQAVNKSKLSKDVLSGDAVPPIEEKVGSSR